MKRVLRSLARIAGITVSALLAHGLVSHGLLWLACHELAAPVRHFEELRGQHLAVEVTEPAKDNRLLGRVELFAPAVGPAFRLVVHYNGKPFDLAAGAETQSLLNPCNSLSPPNSWPQPTMKASASTN